MENYQYLLIKLFLVLTLLYHMLLWETEAFPLHKNIKRPYPGTRTRHDETKAIFNYRLSRARRLSENVFGILTQKFRVYQRRLQMSPEHIDNLIVVYITSFGGDSRTTEIDVGDNSIQTSHVSTIQDLRNVGGKATEEALYIREEFRNYFCATGAVGWQMDMVRKGYRNRQK
ncbi:hypothetical protein NQ317_000055 [Molorchus minor]|uniref:DDE Tnp4 domain-containing protein n=1 Tax=Molorchus minor TaxID=1323400 RepID=A0ABQ9JJL7_9CUCU|nr:hypothetical protein NQ317_000055 [Molorchus minor]